MKWVSIFLLVTISTFGQSDNFFTTQESDENVNTSNNVTRINLFSISFAGKKIPINLVYRHTGIKVNDIPSVLGFGWDIENMGMIKQIVNDNADNIGWFNGHNYNDTTNFFAIGNCDVNLANGGGDRSPDFFSCSSAAGLDFDFVYKQDYPNNPIPFLLTNDPGIRINTNFSNFITNLSQNNNDIVFEITDNQGYTYNFMNGPILSDIHREASPDKRNDFYIKSIQDPNNSQTMTFDYTQYNIETRKLYMIGYTNNSYHGGYDASNGVASKFGSDYYFTDDTRLYIQKITTPDMTVEFILNEYNLMDEIIVKDATSTYVGGYKFIYGYETERFLLREVKKFNIDKSDEQRLFSFQYFYNSSFETSGMANPDGHYEDYFGYNNGVYKDTPFPLKRRISETEIRNAGDFYPNIEYAKLSSLSQIKNVYGGKIDFDYQLNYDNNPNFQDILYGGGLVIKSKTFTSTDSKRKKIQYNYSGLRGYVFSTVDKNRHYTVFSYNDIQYFSKIPRIKYIGVDVNEPFELTDAIKVGNFFKYISEIIYDENDIEISMTRREFDDNYTGIYKTPLLVNEKQYDSHMGLVEETIYTYSYNTIENIIRTIRSSHQRNIPALVCAVMRTYSPIPINRVKLINKKRTIFNINVLQNTIEYNYTYTDDNHSLLRSISESTSENSTIINKFYYATDQELSNTPNRIDLLSRNIIGIPLLEKKYKDSQLIYEEKKSYGFFNSYSNNLLLPQYVYSNKGGNPNASFETEMIYVKYDEKSNLVEYRKPNGISTCLIWGYNQTVPVAKLENITYSEIPQTLITDIHNSSVADIPTALNNLRNSSDLLSHKPMISTYTFKPLIGIESSTNPRGYKTYYEYDSFNRLKLTKDFDGNLIREYEYNYESQN